MADADARFWAIIADPLFHPIVPGLLLGDPSGAGAPERLEVVVSGTAAFGHVGNLSDVGRLSMVRLSEPMAFSYRVSLQVRHPDIHPQKLIDGIGLPAARYWAAGDERMTPKGTLLPGTYRESYCLFNLGEGEDGELASFLRRTLVELEQVATFISDLRGTGGQVSYYVSWYPGDHGEVFDVELLAGMARLKIDLGIEPVC
ncbi:hypothetical protein [Sphingomonas sp. GC_Shp_3]|uniref:hypothetical protein n=1 Tax=Sphingomonas sp. GC_Shp_3 TaxID=2937383 RepID=UPI00226AD612|nr:hypothetical protein [Sphingomonas sp. GC_Shp_3]